MANLFNQQLADKFYNLCSKVYGFEKITKLIPVDFEKPWWTVIWHQKTTFTIIMIYMIVASTFNTTFPILIGVTIGSSNWSYLGGIILAKICLTLFHAVFMNRIYNMLLLQSSQSVAYWANIFFLTTDPVNHSTKSSGQIISKTTRGSGAYELWLDTVFIDLITILINLITVPIIFLQFEKTTALTAFGVLLLIITINTFGRIIGLRVFEPRTIIAEDEQKAVTVETLHQASYIRYCFATNEQAHKIKSKTKKVLVVDAISSIFSDQVNMLTKLVAYIGMALIAVQTFGLQQAGIINPVVAATLLITFYNSSENIGSAGKFIRRLAKYSAHIQDLFTFIRGFGKATYPVLEGEDNSKLATK